MNQLPKDVQSLIKLVRNYHGRIIGPRDSTLTTIQREQATRRLQQTLADEGITYNHSYYDSGEERLALGFKALYVRDCGVIADVRPTGPYPIQLSVGENVSVAFEPRDISGVDHWYHDEIDNTRFANLRKGSSFDFSGRLVGCDYYPKDSLGSLSLRVESEIRLPMLISVADRLRKAMWDGRPSGVDFKRR